MTKTLKRAPGLHTMTVEVPSAGSRSPLARLAGPLAVVAGGLITVAQLVMLPFDPKDHVATSQSPVVPGRRRALHGRLRRADAGAHRRVRLGGAPRRQVRPGRRERGGRRHDDAGRRPLVRDLRGAVDRRRPGGGAGAQRDPSALLALGAISSYLLFAIGWAMFGIASFRARVFPKVLCIALVIGGIIGFQALLAPFAIPLGIAVAALGVWMIRTTRHVETGRVRAPA